MTKSLIPPLNLNSCASTGSTRSSRKRISRPLLRNAISRRRSMSVWRTEFRLLEDGLVGPEGDRGAVLLGGPGPGELVLGLAALGEVLDPPAAVAVDLDVESARQRVDHRRPHAVQAARDLVALTPELPARVQHRHDHLGRGLALVLGVVVDGHTSAVVDDSTAAIGQQGHVDPRAVARHRLVDGVVDDLVDQVVEARGAGRSDVHPGPLADRFETFENRDVLGAVRHARAPHSLLGRPSGEAGARPGAESVKPQVRALKIGAFSVPDGTPDRGLFVGISRLIPGPEEGPRARGAT